MRLPSIVALVLVHASPLVADEGRIPIAGQTSISQPGHYILTRDISGSVNPGISVYADNVTVDLGGRTISWAGYSPISIGDGYRDITIRNGRIRGGTSAVRYFGTTVRTRVRLEDLDIDGATGYGIYLFGVEHVQVVRCRISNVGSTAIHVEAGSGSFTGEVRDNTVADVSGFGIYLHGLQHGHVEGNRVSGHGASYAAAGIWIGASSAALSGGNLIVGNVVGSSADDVGISVAVGRGNVIRGNVCRGNGSHGIAVAAGYNLIEDNQSQGNGGWGLSITGGTSNRYRDNMLLNNTTGAVSGGQDEGGNITS